MGSFAAGLQHAALTPRRELVVKHVVNRVEATAGLAVRSWSGESSAAVFSQSTVRTHLVSEAAAAVLDLAGIQSVTAAEAATLLVEPDQPLDSAASDISAAQHLMEETITGLVAAGLLRRVE